MINLTEMGVDFGDIGCLGWDRTGWDREGSECV